MVPGTCRGTEPGGHDGPLTTQLRCKICREPPFNSMASLLPCHREEVFDDLRALLNLLRPRTMVETPRVQPIWAGPMRPDTPLHEDEPNLDELSDGKLLRYHDDWAERVGLCGRDPYDPYLECSPTRREDVTAIRAPPLLPQMSFLVLHRP